MVAFSRFEVSRQTIARTIRPPSSGKAGRRLKTRISRLMFASQASTATPVEMSAFSSNPAPSQNVLPSIATPSARQANPITIVTAGPAAAIRNSAPALSGSRSRAATPPNIQSVIDEMPIPFRWAMTAWPSSWRRIEAKKPKALTTASTYGSTESWLVPRMSR